MAKKLKIKLVTPCGERYYLSKGKMKVKHETCSVDGTPIVLIFKNNVLAGVVNATESVVDILRDSIGVANKTTITEISI